jgi:hypothetical protein
VITDNVLAYPISGRPSEIARDENGRQVRKCFADAYNRNSSIIKAT